MSEYMEKYSVSRLISAPPGYVDYDGVYGTRLLKRFVQKKLETLIARKILSQEIMPNATIKIDYNAKDLIIK